MQIPVYNLAGEAVDHIEVSEQVFAVPFNKAVVHQTLVRQQANARQGTASTKTRGEVAGSTRKLFRQKGTGNARAGSIKSPLRRGGGITFGPKPRSYRQAMPKKMRQLALRCALSAKIVDGEIKILEELKLEEPKTKNMVEILAAMEASYSTLIVTGEPEINVVKSARNLPKIKIITASLLNVLDILSYKMLFMTETAVRKAERLWGQSLTQEENHASL